MILLFKFYLSGCCYMRKNFSVLHAQYTADDKHQHTHVLGNTQIHVFFKINLICPPYFAIVIMTDRLENHCRKMRSGRCLDLNKKVTTNVFNLKNNRVTDICNNTMQEDCQEKSSSSSWQRRDSFSSCSSDSAVYCSSRHTQDTINIAQDTINKRLIEESIGKKRHRHSSGSSALSSASENSGKDVSEMLTCLNHNDACSEVKQSLTTVSTQSSINYPSAITSQSEIKTIVEEATVTYTCSSEKSRPKTEGYHNLRRQIRKTTCHNCDCEKSHTIFYRRLLTTTTTTTKHALPKVNHKALCQSIPKPKQELSLNVSPVKPQQKLSPSISPVKQIEENSLNDLPKADQSDFTTPKPKVNKKRRNEVDNLYAALHEIKWAKHMSPDNILSQIDFRRAASVPFYSNKNRPRDSNSTKTFKTPQTDKRKVFTKGNCTKEQLPEHVCTRRTRSSTCCKPTESLVPPHSSRKSRNCKINSLKNSNVSPISLSTFLKNKDKTNGFHLCSKSNIVEEKCSSNKLNEIISAMPYEINNEDEFKEVNHVHPPYQNSSVSLQPSIDVNDISSSSVHSSENVEQEMLCDNTVLEEILPLDDCPTSHYVYEAPCIEGEVVITSLDPYIVDIENMDVCYEEVISESNTEVTSPILPLLSKITPIPEHTSDDCPPDLDLCAEIPCSDFNVCSNSQNLLQSELLHQDTVTEVEYEEQEDTTQSAEDKPNECFTNANSETPVSKVFQFRNGFKNHKTLSQYNSLRKRILEKYFPRSKARLKTAVCLSTLKKRDPTLVCSQSTHIVKTDAHVNTVNDLSNSVTAFNEEDCKEILKNDSLRVHVTGLDPFVIRDQLEHYNHIFNNSRESITCMSVETSQVKNENSKCVTFTQKKYHYTNGKRLDTNSKLSLEYNKSNCQSDISIPFNFTVHYRCITVNKNDGYTQVIFKLTKGQNTYLSAEALRELRDTLHRAASDSHCQVLIMNSIGKSFCMGLDLRPLLGPKKAVASKEIAVAVKDFIEALASFSKPLVVVVNGETAGIGVTMLAYSDVIIASDAATFHMPYSQLGFSPEGAATLMLPFVVGSTVAMDMLLRGRKLSAYEACGYGLVTEVLKANCLPLKLVERVRQLAESPGSVMETTKSMLRMHLYHRLGMALETETLMLPKQWLSEPCQTALKTAFMNGFMD